jgi:hypothetical protein
MDDGILSKIFSAAAGVWAMAAMAFVALFRAWPLIMEKINERKRDQHGERSGDWSRLRAEIERLDGRCDHLQTEVDECREREGEWMKRAIAAEAALLGKGHAQQEAQMIVSKERTKDNGNGK